jgi:hypothetical protein
MDPPQTGWPVTKTFARAYIAMLLIFELLLIAASFSLNVSLWTGFTTTCTRRVQSTQLAALLSCLVIAVFAKERNVWRNEFRSCPPWVRFLVSAGTVLAFVLFAITIVSGPTVLFSLSALILGFEAISFCVLYSVMWAPVLGNKEIEKRCVISFVVAIACVGGLTAVRFGLFQQLLQ